jgi:outer membrane protein OmpA-like peptidoglycan-associated protein
LTIGGAAVPDARVDWTVTGAHPRTDSTFTAANGQAQLCLSGPTPGTDAVTAAVASPTATASVTWSMPVVPPPVVVPPQVPPVLVPPVPPVPPVKATVTVTPNRLVIAKTAKTSVATCSLATGSPRTCSVVVTSPTGAVLARGSASAAPRATTIPVRLTFTSAAFKAAANHAGVDGSVTATVTNTAGAVGQATAVIALRPATIKLTLVSDTLFASGSAKLSAAAARSLAGTAKNLVRAQLVTCFGHTDSVGSTKANQQLGLARARAVCGILGKHATKVRSVSYGETKPRATNGTAAGRAKNRRVEVKVTY